jgi:TfoX/Sxy family transcriptional regulator of competence genes
VSSKGPRQAPPNLERYERLVATIPAVERKGATLPYTSLNGHMFSFVAEDGTVVLRLAADDRATFMERYGAEPHEAHGSVMREYASVPDALADDTPSLAPWFERSRAYVAGLKPKASRRAP